jgi:methylthioribose-1-phosphate isomerase
MKVQGHDQTAIWLNEGEAYPHIIDQRWLPHELVIEELRSVECVVTAISDMHVRGAPLIGATAAAGMYIAALHADHTTEALQSAASELKASRPTAVNLEWAISQCLSRIDAHSSPTERLEILRKAFLEIRQQEIDACYQIGVHGVSIIEGLAKTRNDERPIQILTHCNAGWLACVDYGTATAPIYEAHNRGIPVHVWVDETRPRNQGARLTAWELLEHGVPHTIITDNAGGHLMQHALVDLVIVGTDRTTRTGDVANKIGTYLKALAAYDCQIPFYVAAPSSSIDWSLTDGRSIPIEQRDEDEVKCIQGRVNGKIERVLLTPEASPAANYAFDVTPARLVTGLITERGICPATENGICGLFPEHRH